MSGVAESFIEDKTGHGIFQILVLIFVYLNLRACAASSFIFMSFGTFNPGWRCLDNVTNHVTLPNNQSQPDFVTYNGILNQSITFVDEMKGQVSGDFNTTNNEMRMWSKGLRYVKEMRCEDFKRCRNVEFDPDSVTIVTEWSLVCDKAWIAALLISLQMFGGMVASVFAGYIADRFGRKKSIYTALFANGVLFIVCMFIDSWKIFAGFIFLIGVCTSVFESCIFVYSSEFMTKKWRGPLSGVPGWAFGGLLFGCTAMVLRNRKYVLLAVAALSGASLHAVFWMPESLRWLEVKRRKKDLEQAMRKIMRLNGRQKEEFFKDHNSELQDNTCHDNVISNDHSIFDLFRPGYRLTTIIVAVVWLSISLIYFALTFGLKALSGDFYINSIIFYAILFPASVIPAFLPNLIGRTKSSCLLMLTVSVCLLTAAAMETFIIDGRKWKDFILCLVFFAILCLDSTINIQQVHCSELYPTVVRGSAMSWVSLSARIGTIIAPFIIPNDSQTVNTWYLIMGILAIMCCLIITKLPETRGITLKEAFSVELMVTMNGKAVVTSNSQPQSLNVHEDEIINFNSL